MSSRDLSLAMRLYADATRFVSGLNQAESGVRRFGGAARREFDALKNTLGTVQGKLASIGVSVGTVATIMQSARMDKSLAQIGQTAGVSAAEVAKLRKELFAMAGETGQNVDELQRGFGDLVASGLSFKEAKGTIGAINKGLAVSTATSTDLANALTVASTAFNFDLSSPGKALELLDKMVVAGGLGSAELNNLPSIFARIGVNAKSAGMDFEGTLAFIEVLSKVEKQPERLATLADSTLRLFNNANYMTEAAKATGIKFFEKDANGRNQTRNPMAILRDMKREYDKLTDDKSRFIFMNKAFGKADLDTIKGMRTLLGEDMLTFGGEFKEKILNSLGETEKRLPDAIANSVDQVGRLKAELRNAADGFAKPINETLSNWIKFALDKQANGGLGLDGTDMIVGGTAGVLGTIAAARYGGKGISALMKRFGGTAAGLAEGKALEAAAGVTPVFVVNWPASMGVAGPLTEGAAAVGKKAAPLLAASAPLAIAGGALYASYQAYGAYGRLSETQARVEKETAERNARRAEIDKRLMSYGGTALLTATKNYDMQQLNQVLRGIEHAQQSKMSGEIRVKVDQDGRVASVRATSSNASIPMRVDAGMTMVAP